MKTLNEPYRHCKIGLLFIFWIEIGNIVIRTKYFKFVPRILRHAIKNTRNRLNLNYPWYEEIRKSISCVCYVYNSKVVIGYNCKNKKVVHTKLTSTDWPIVHGLRLAVLEPTQDVVQSSSKFKES